MRLEGLVIPISWEMGGWIKGLTMIADGLKETIKQTVDYANSVRQLSMVSGQSTEEASRFIQVLDDYKITADDALVATRALTKEGYAPSIETLAQLSDQYLEISGVEKRNEFVLKNLGRAGLQWIEVLNQGSDALRAQGQAVEAGLLLSEEQVAAARKNELAVDRWNDSMKAATITLGNQLLPIMTTAVNHLNALATANTRLVEEGLRPGTAAYYARRIELVETIKKEQAAQDALIANTEALKENAFALLLDEEAMKKLHAANSAMIGSIMNVQTEIDGYNSSAADLAAQQGDLLNRMEALRKEGVEEMSSEMVNLQREYANTGLEIEKLAVSHEDAMKRIVFSLLMAKLEADGLTSAEFNIALAAGESLGMIDKDTVAMAQRFDALAQKIADSGAFIASGSAAMFQAALTGQTLTKFAVLHPPGYVFDNDPRPGRASGGSAGGMTWVGERGPELVNLPGGSYVNSAQQSQGMSQIDYERMGRSVAQHLVPALQAAGFG